LPQIHQNESNAFFTFLVEITSAMTANVQSVPLNKVDFTKTTLPIVWLLFTLLAVEAYNLSSKLSTKIDQMHYPASRTSFPTPLRQAEKQQLY